MKYPKDFPAESLARVEAARIRAGRRFDSKKAKARWKSEIEDLFWAYVLTPFLVFAAESSRLKLWPVDKMDQRCQEFLRCLTIDAYCQKGKAAGLSDPIDNFSCDIRWRDQQEIEATAQWHKYEGILLKLAESVPAQNSGKTVHPTEGEPDQRQRGPDYEKSRKRVALEDRLRSELGKVKLRAEKYTTVEMLQREFPDFALWNMLSSDEKNKLLTEEFKPRAYARTLVTREFGLTSRETIKKDRQKLLKREK